MLEHPKVELLTVNRDDANNALSSFSKHAFELDGAEWPSVEHYYQAMKFDDPAYRELIRQAETPTEASKLGHSRFRKRRSDWKKNSTTYMIRGTYTKCRTHPEVAEELLASGDIKIANLTMYDYFWGSGRDMRGKNNYGKVLMAVRDKLKEEADQQG